MVQTFIEVDADPMPVIPIGLGNGTFYIRSAAGEDRQVYPEGLLDRSLLIGLFGGEAWLRRNFPEQRIIVTQRSGGGRSVPIGIDVKAAAFAIAHRCVDAEEARLAAAPREIHRVSRWTRFRARVFDWLGWQFSALRATF